MAQAEPRVILIAGMHRSGTSALSRAINLLGAAIPEPLVPPLPGNELGHWEPARVVEMNDAALAAAGAYENSVFAPAPEWFGSEEAGRRRDQIAEYVAAELRQGRPILLKDPRISLLAPLWRDALQRLGVEAGFILAFRRADEVGASLNRRQIAERQPGVWSPERADLLWLNHVLSAERATRGARRAFVAFDALLDDWRRELRRVARQLGLVWPRGEEDAAIDAFLQPGRKRETSQPGTEDSGRTERLYDALLACVDEPGSGVAVFDAAAEEFAASRLLHPYVVQLEARVAAATGGETPDAGLAREARVQRDRAEALEVRIGHALRTEAQAEALSERLEQAQAELAACAPADGAQIRVGAAHDLRDALAHAARLGAERDALAAAGAAEAAEALAERERGARRLAEAEARTAELERRVRELRASVHERNEPQGSPAADVERRRLAAQLAAERERADRLGREIEALRASSSWRVTGPVRSVSAILRRR